MEVNLSIFAVFAIFLITLLALNRLLFKPLLRVLGERAQRTEGVLAQANQTLARYNELFERYQKAIKEARLEGYRYQESVRAEALRQRGERINAARAEAEKLISDAKAQLNQQVEKAKVTLEREAREIAAAISYTILQRQVTTKRL